jgi:hypothetical protein
MADIDDDVAPPAPEEETPPVEEVPTAVVASTEDPQEPDAVELKPGEPYVPVSALKALREQIKALKPQAERAGQLEQQLNQDKPYADFLRNNPHLLKAPAPAAPAVPAEDTVAAQYAQKFDLYTADGKPDVVRARAIMDDNRQMAREEAQTLIQPMQERTDMQAASANLQRVQTAKDANGQALEQQYIDAAIAPIIQQMSRPQALKVLADPQVAELIKFTALGYQAASKKSGAPVTPQNVPLHVEAAGGGSQYAITDAERKLAKQVGRTEKDWTDGAKRYKPNSYNVLE